MEVWVRQPGVTHLVMGWFREGAQLYPDALFLSSGDMQIMTFAQLLKILVTGEEIEQAMSDPRNISLHLLLHLAAREALTSRDYITLNEEDSNQPYGPVSTQAHWTTLLIPISTAALAYIITCVECNHPRAVSQRETFRVTQLSKKNPFTCADIGLRCHTKQTDDGIFITIAPASVSDITPTHTPPVVANRPEAASPATMAIPNAIMWRKLIKHYGNISYYDGSSNLTKLISWKKGLLEGFATLGIPLGREQVLAAVQFLKDKARDWWESIISQSEGSEIQQFDELYDALHERFIPRQMAGVRMKAWNSLYHKGTVHDYMTEVNDLALAHPLGEEATFWHAWHGLRPEFKSEIDHMLDQQGRQTCSLKELKQMLLSIELKYPYRQPKPFPPRYNVRQVNTFQPTQPQQHQQSRSTFACWICASPDHRMEGCPKKKKSGCPICGSRAHKPFLCPQRRAGPPNPNRRPPTSSTTARVILEEDSSEDNSVICTLATKYTHPQSSQPRSLIYRLSIKGGIIDVFVDPGSELSLISEKVVNDRMILTTPLLHPVYIIFADKSRVRAHAQVIDLQISKGEWSDKVTCVVVPSLTEPIYLGRDWLRKWNPTIDWISGEIQLSGSLEPWIPMDKDFRKEKKAIHDSIDEILTPSASRKCLRVARRNEDIASTYGFVIVRAVDTNTDAHTSSTHPYIKEMQTTFGSVFAEATGIEENPPVRHSIRIKDDAMPAHVKPFRFTETQKGELKTQIIELLQKGWIRPSCSPWGAPVLLVPKKDGTWRFCVDFRNLNAVTIRDSFPLPRIDDLLHKVGRARIYSKMDMQSGFHQVPMESSSVEYTAFSLPEAVEGCSHYEWLVMPFGLMNAPSTFQRLISKVLVGCEAFTSAYIDDVLVFSDNEDEHKIHLRRVFECLINHNLRIKPKKCEFFQSRISFLGHVLHDGQISVEYPKIEALEKWHGPLTTIRQVRQFLGLASYYRMFVPNFSAVAAPLSAMTRKDSRVIWSDEAQKALDTIIDTLKNAPPLMVWDSTRQTRVTTDASLVGIGAILEQYDDVDSKWKPIAYWSRKLLPPQTRYHTTDREWLAVVEALTNAWWFWLRDRDFILRTDHSPLKSLLQTPSPHLSHRQSRWVEKLQPYRFTFEHIRGDNNKVADALSRAPEFECRAIEIHSPPALQMSQIKTAAQNDPEYSQIDVSKIHGEWEHRDNIWYSVDEVPIRCIIPNDDIIRDRIISELHETPLAGHLGVKKTYERVKTYFYWHGMKASIEEFVRTCDICQRASTKPPENINVHTIIARHPWEVVTIDFLCGFAPATHTKHTSCIVITDKHTRQIHLRSCILNPTAAETAQMFMEMVVCKHGLPKLIISDRGTQFDSTLWLKLFETLGSRCALASTHHPQTNGATERVNRTLIQMIRKYASTQQTKWAQFLPYFEFAYNSAVHSTTGIAPFVAELGRMPNIPIAMLMPIDRPDAPTDIRTKIYEIATQMQSIRNNILVADEKAADTKPYVHLPDHSDSFIPGDEVLLYAPYLPLQAEHRKHVVTWKGPFIILREITAGAYELTGIEKTLPTVYHQSKLRKYNRTTRPDERINMPPQPLEFIDGYVIFEVDAILDHRTLRGKRQYQLRWKGTSETSWEDEVNLTGCVALLRQYLISIGEGGRVLPPELTSERAAPLSSPDNTSLMTQPPAPQSQPIPSTTPPMRRSRRLSMTQV